jgi:hypothetical protein
MKYGKVCLTALLAGILSNCPAPAQSNLTSRAPVIKHAPVTTAVRGQSISVRATVTDKSSSVKSVTLFYTTSRDAAPFKITMQDAGAGSYIGSIPASLIKGITELSYYIEALNEQDVGSETPWYTVKFQAPQPVATPPVAAPVVTPAPQVQTPPAGTPPLPRKQTSVEPEKETTKRSWKGPAIIAGATAAVIGGALIAANKSSDDSSSTTPPAADTAGTYSGSAVRVLYLSGVSPVSETYSVTIVINSAGAVSSDNLHPEQRMDGVLVGSQFLLIGQISDTNFVGQVNYGGTVANGRIAGNIQGTVASATGTNGTYSGSFSATR